MSAAMFAALAFTVLLLVTTAYFIMGSIPLLVLKHDTPLDARFVRAFFNVYYVAAFVTASATAISYALAGRPVVASGAALLAMGEVPGVQEKGWRRLERIDLSDSQLQCAHHVRIGRALEADMGVADLHESKIPARPRRRFRRRLCRRGLAERL